MALLKFGGGIVNMVGSMAGNTFARNRYGAYVRARIVPANPKSTAQQSVRAALGSLRNSWQNVLTVANRSTWLVYANGVSMVNKLGEAMKLSAFNHYVRSNSLRIQAGVATIATAPTMQALAEMDPSITLIPDVSSSNVSITFDNTLGWAGEVGGYLMVYQGLPRGATRVFYGGPFRYAGKIAGAGTPPTSPQVITNPFAGILNQVCTYQFRIVRADGRASGPFRATGTFVA